MNNKDTTNDKEDRFTRGRVNWSKVDWTLSDSELAVRLDVHQLTVYRNRKDYAPTTVRNKRIVWDSLDWRKSDEELAEQLSVSVGTVKSQREYVSKRSKHTLDWDTIDWSLPTTVLADTFGYSMSYISSKRRIHAPHTLSFNRRVETTKPTARKRNWLSRTILTILGFD